MGTKRKDGKFHVPRLSSCYDYRFYLPQKILLKLHQFFLFRRRHVFLQKYDESLGKDFLKNL